MIADGSLQLPDGRLQAAAMPEHAAAPAAKLAGRKACQIP